MPPKTRLLLLASALLISLAPASQAADNKPNFILFLADDMGWNAPSGYGSDLHETPNLDQLAEEGVKFTNGYAACTVCSPSRAAILTGMYPARLHVTNWITGTKMPLAKLTPPDWTLQLENHHITLAEALKDAGYRTAHIGKWHLGGEGFQPQDSGFEKNIGGTSAGSPPGGYFLLNNLDLPKAKEGEYLTDHLTDRALDTIEEWKDEPFFIYFPFYNVHTPIQGKQELVDYYSGKVKEDGIHTNPTFAAMVHSVDENVGRVMAKLKELDLDDNTVIVFTSDNGGLSHRNDKATGICMNTPLRRGKGSSFEGGTRVPLIVKVPGITPAGAVCDTPVCGVDFYPTFLEMAGAKGDAGHNANVDGVSLTSILKDPEAKLGRESIYWHFPHYHAGGDSPYAAVRTGDFKLIEYYEDGSLALYNVEDDPGESKDLAQAMPEKAAEMAKQLADWRVSVDAQMMTPNPDYDPDNWRANPKRAKDKKKQ